MAHKTFSDSETNGNETISASYSCDGGGFGYSKISPEIKSEFDFLGEGGTLQNKLDEVYNEINTAAENVLAFEFENGSSVKDISKARDEIKTDIELIKTQLTALCSAFKTDIDNINMELEYNFGWIVIGSVNGTTTTKTTVTTTTDQ